jgi:prophage regulatory protein
VGAASIRGEPDKRKGLTRRDVSRLTGLSRSTLKRRRAEGTFPAPMQLGPRRIGWPAPEIKTWWPSSTNNAAHHGNSSSGHAPARRVGGRSSRPEEEDPSEIAIGGIERRVAPKLERGHQDRQPIAWTALSIFPSFKQISSESRLLVEQKQLFAHAVYQRCAFTPSSAERHRGQDVVR